jgi:hypothetical protein
MTEASTPTDRLVGIEDHVRAMRRLIADMPYSGLLTTNTSTIETLADVERVLVDLRSVLRNVAREAEAERAELFELRSQRAAMRRFLGTA